MDLVESRTGDQSVTGQIFRIFQIAPLVLCLGLIVGLTSGCASTRLDPYFTENKSEANVYVTPMRSDIAKIAVLPFRGPTELIGSSVSDMFVTEMLRANKYTLVERSQMAGVLSETELSLAGLSELKAVEVAKMLGADGVVIGTVDEYSTQAKSGKTYAVAGVSMRLINCTSGQIIWSADLAKMSESAHVPLSQHGRAVVHEIMCGLYQNWMKQKADPIKKTSSRSSAPPASMSPAPAVPPPVPQTPTASDMGLREVTLNWKSAGTTADKFRIERATVMTGPFTTLDTVSPSRESFRDRNDLRDATVYYYRLVAIGSNGLESKPSTLVESMTAPPPDPPAEVKVTAPSSRCVAVSWTPPRSEGVECYRVERAEAVQEPTWSLRCETDKTSFVDGGKAGCDTGDSAKYRYRVTAVNRVGAVGQPSPSGEVETLPPPELVADFFAMPLQVRCVPLSWAVSPEADVCGYEVERRESAEGGFARLTVIKDKATTHYLDGRRDPGNLADDQTYAYRIRAFNGVGSYGEWTDPLEVATRSAPPAPVGVGATSGLPRSVEVVWNASEDEKVVGYVVERCEGGNGLWIKAGTVQGVGSTKFLDRAGASSTAPTGKLKDGMTYSYRVGAFNTAEVMSPWSDAVDAVTKLAPVMPTGISTTDDIPATVVVAWASNPESDIEFYVVEARSADGSRWREVGTTDKTTLSEEKLDPGERRVYRVKAVDVCTHESQWSIETAGSSRPLPGSPSAVSVEWSSEGAKLSWTPPRDGMSEFRLYKKGFISSEKITSSLNPAAIIEAGLIGKKATIYVTAVDEKGLESEPSESVEIRPL